ncbi:hypothetical protein F0562_035033 [Nyssa sinensis]|uniref:CCHC-type domain-containing protein n=1 Tax=Nyssa sinensis TaxID=561372 RepID=A0A5J5AD80_9ASTE|nr:hypothetical protein F0562_035033 [Nyssa sinensis]
MKEGETVDNFFARTLTIANKMKAHGETMSQTIINEKVLRSMTSKFDYVVCSIEESNDLNTTTIDELQSSLLVHEQRMNGHHGEEQVLKVTHEDNTSRGRGRGVFKGRGRGRGRQLFNKATIECFKCHKLGHFQYECPSWENGANYAELDEGEELLLMSFIELNHAQREAGDSDEEGVEAENEGEFGVEANKNEEASSNGTNGAGSSGTSSPSSESHDENSSGPVQGRARRVPRWM